MAMTPVFDVLAVTPGQTIPWMSRVVSLGIDTMWTILDADLDAYKYINIIYNIHIYIYAYL